VSNRICNSHSIPRDHPIRSTILVAPMLSHELPLRIYLHTPKDVLRVRYPPPVRRIPVIAYMNPTSSVPTTHSPLMTRSARAISVAAGCATEVEAAGRRVHSGLLLNIRVLCCVQPNYRVENRTERRVFGEIARCGWDRGAGSQGQLGIRRVGREECQEGACRVLWMFEDVLWND
jgi:hypothetical protein